MMMPVDPLPSSDGRCSLCLCCALCFNMSCIGFVTSCRTRHAKKAAKGHPWLEPSFLTMWSLVPSSFLYQHFDSCKYNISNKGKRCGNEVSISSRAFLMLTLLNIFSRSNISSALVGVCLFCSAFSIWRVTLVCIVWVIISIPDDNPIAY